MANDPTELPLAEVQRGEHVIIECRRTGQPLRIAKCLKVLLRQAYFKSGGFLQDAYSLKTGNQIGGTDTRFRRATPEQVAEAEAKIEECHATKEARKDAEVKAAYDALPEAIKLARKVRWAFECNSEKAVATMPVELLRAVWAWIEASPLEKDG